MSTEPHPPAPASSRLVAGWHMLRDGYRYANLLSHHALGFLFKALIVAYFVFGGVFLSLRYLVLPNIDSYKGNIEQIASQAVGQPVSIARIYASWHGIRPNLFLGDVVIRDKDGRQALTLPSVSATLSWWSLFAFDVRFNSLDIIRPDLDIRREVDGKLYVAGMFVDPNKGGDGKGFDWVLSQHEIVIREGRVRWTDAKRGAPELALEGVHLVLLNRWRRHQFGLKAIPPADLSAPVDVRANFVHPAFARKISDVGMWRGQLYVDLGATDLSVWKRYVDYPIEVPQGKGSVRAWLNLDQAKVADFTADLKLSNVSARLRKDLPLLNLAQVSGRISAQEKFDPNAAGGMPTFGAQGYALALTDFSMQTEDGLVLPTTTINETFVPAKKGVPEKTEISARLLELQTLANFAGHLPLSAAQRQLLTDFAPRGQLRDFSAAWQGSYPDIVSYNVKGQFAGLSLRPQPARLAQPKTATAPALAAVPAIPGFENLTGRVDANDRGGQFSLASTKLALQMPGYFAQPAMAFDSLKMQADWAFQGPDQVLFQIDRMDFVQDGMHGILSGTHLAPLKSTPGKSLGKIDLTGHFSGLDLTKIERYLPLQTPEHLQQWLTGALEGGKADDVALRLKGDLADFPFHAKASNDKPSGEFRIIAKIDNGKLNYTPGSFAKDNKTPLWPQTEQINGTLLIDRTRLEVRADSAKTGGVALSNVTAVIPDLLSNDSQLEIDGSAAGALQDFVRYTNVSPVAGWIGNFTEESKGSGNAKLALKLQLPLDRMHDAKVQGTLQFANNDVILQGGMPPLVATNGKLEFHENGVRLNGLAANFLGGAASISGGSQPDGTILIKASGSASAGGLRKAYPIPAVQRLADHLNGSTPFAATISVRNHQPEILLESSLQGLALDFPAPLRKAANESMPLKFQLSGLPSADAQNVRDQIKMSLGSAIALSYLRQKPVEKNASWHVVRGGIGVNVPAPEPDSGLTANVELKSLNLDAWRSVASAIAGAGNAADKTVASTAATESAAKRATAGNGGAASPATLANADRLNFAQYVEPDSMAARATELLVMGKALDNVVVGASHQNGVWQANIDSRQASGYVTWNEGRAGQGLGRVTARLASLVIPKSAAPGVGDLLEGKNSATQIPALDVVADNFELFGKKMGRLELQANNVRAAEGREWRINTLSLTNSDAVLKASGKWLSMAGDSNTSLAYTLEVQDAGKLLDRFGFAGVLRGGKGKMNGDLNWNGLPFSIDIPTLSGKMQLDMAAGQFLKVDPGAAKLLGVLSLQALPRHLTLDFRDVFSEGFAFDGVTASADISRGLVKTDNLKMRSVNATVLMDGSADIAKETQNLHVVVIPEINIGAASVAYALAINPVIGLGSFLAQLFLRDPLMRAFTFEYRITGGWTEPTVTKLANKAGKTNGTASEAADNAKKVVR